MIQSGAGIAVAVLLAIAFGCSACRMRRLQRLPVALPVPAVSPFHGDARLVKAHNRFGLHLFHQLVEEEPDRNVFVSPYSVSVALEFISNGSAAQTHTDLHKALCLIGMTDDEVNAGNKGLASDLRHPAGGPVDFVSANHVWVADQLPVSSAFEAVGEKYFNGAVHRCSDLADPQSISQINALIEHDTYGLIPNLISEPVARETCLILTNAMCFRGRWAVSFDPKRTRQLPFIHLDWSKTMIPMMVQEGEFPYFRGESFKAVQLPYADGRTAICLFLPDGGPDGIHRFLQSLDQEAWDRWFASFQMKEGSISLPKLNVRYGTRRLRAALTALGAGVAFDSQRADFSRLTRSSERVWIDDVFHQAVLELDETGTRAAAATAVNDLMGDDPNEPFSMTMNHPFFCAIVDVPSTQILFCGVIIDP